MPLQPLLLFPSSRFLILILQWYTCKVSHCKMRTSVSQLHLSSGKAPTLKRWTFTNNHSNPSLLFQIHVGSTEALQLSLKHHPKKGMYWKLNLKNNKVSTDTRETKQLSLMVKTGANNHLKCSKCMAKISNLSKSVSHFYNILLPSRCCPHVHR